MRTYSQTLLFGYAAVLCTGIPAAYGQNTKQSRLTPEAAFADRSETILTRQQKEKLNEARPLLSGKLFNDALNHRQSLNAKGIQLRQVITDFQARTGIAVLLDRRVDPSTIIDVKTGYVTTREVLTAIATASGGQSVSVTDRYILIGPDSATSRLRTLVAINNELIQHLRRDMNADVYRGLIQPLDASWEHLAQPRQLLIDRAATAGIKIPNPELVPHDLWAAATLPALPFSDFATLILNQFDLTFEINAAGEMKITDMPTNVTVERRHRVPVREKETVTKRWMTAHPQLNITWRGSTAIVSATVETHEQLKAMIRDDSTAMIAAAGIQHRKFTMQAPPGTTLGQLIVSFRNSGVPVRITGKTDADLAPLLQETTEFKMEGVAGKEFFPTVFKTWKAQIEVSDDEVVITFPE